MDNKITMDGKYAYRKDPFTQVRILCVDRPGMRGSSYSSPVLTMDGEGNFEFHTPTGANPYQPNHDLVPLQEKLPDLWALSWPTGELTFYPNKTLAMKVQADHKNTPDLFRYIPAPDQTS